MRLAEVLTGIETYQIPEHSQHIIVKVDLEPLEDIISHYIPMAKKKDDYTVEMNSYRFAMALIDGYVPAVHSLFVNESYILYSGLEFETLRASRDQLIGTAFIDRSLSEFDQIFKESNIPFEQVTMFDKEQWKNRISLKIYCIFQLDSLYRILNHQEIPGEPINFLELYDLPQMDAYIDRLYEKVKDKTMEYKKNIYKEIDFNFIIRTLRIDYIKNLDKYK